MQRYMVLYNSMRENIPCNAICSYRTYTILLEKIVLAKLYTILYYIIHHTILHYSMMDSSKYLLQSYMFLYYSILLENIACKKKLQLKYCLQIPGPLKISVLYLRRNYGTATKWLLKLELFTKQNISQNNHNLLNFIYMFKIYSRKKHKLYMVS